MNGTIILNLAMSLDGYIAKDDDSYAWIKGHGDAILNTPTQFSYPDFLSDIDIVVLGRRCYDLKMHADFKDKQVLVATSHPQPDHDNVVFETDIVARLKAEKARGQRIYLFGGGVLVSEFLKADLIDTYIIGIIPTLLGQGIPLFVGRHEEWPLHLDKTFIEDGMVILQYSRRNP